MSDLQLQLRNRAKGYEVGPATFALLNDAADRIAQLEAAIHLHRQAVMDNGYQVVDEDRTLWTALEETEKTS